MDVHGREISPQGEPSSINQTLEATRGNSAMEALEAKKDDLKRSEVSLILAQAASGALPSSTIDDVVFQRALGLFTGAALAAAVVTTK